MGCTSSKCCGGGQIEPEEVIEIGKLESQVKTSTVFLVFVNPHSGKGRSLKHYHRIVAPLLTKHGIGTRVIQTERPNHAQELIQAVNLNDYRGLLILSGDGLVFEILNGLIKRDDWREALQFPIGVIPTGSGNALVASIFHANGVSFKPGNQLIRDATLSIPSALPQSISLFHVETDTEQHLIGFLSISWGLLADIDTESEKYRRCLGSARFTAGGIECAIRKRTYHGRVSYLPDLRNAQEKSNNTIIRQTSLPPAQRPDPISSTYTRTSMRLTKLEKIKNTTFPDVESKLVSGRLTSWATDSPTIPQLKHHCTCAVDKDGDSAKDVSSLPPSWIVEEADWTAVIAVSLSHLGTDVCWCPSADCRPENPLLHLVLIRKNEIGNRAQMIRWMIDLTPDARHAVYPFFHVIPVLAVRIEPATGASPLVVDGEVIRCGKIQATATTHTARILAPTASCKDNKTVAN